MCSSSADRREAALLLRRGREDETVVAKLIDDAQIADAVIGFHAQQAVEKALKAVLAHADRCLRAHSRPEVPG